VLSRYLYGAEFAPRDVKLALVESGRGKVGSAADKLLLLCYQYNPEQGKYGGLVMSLLRAGGAVTLLVLGASIFAMSRRRDGARPAKGEPAGRPRL
jgi:protein SCO1/2